MHNSAICSNREIFKTEQETKTGTPTPKNYASNVLENPVNKKQVRTKILFDQGSQRSYVTQRIMNFLNLKTISISIFLSKSTENSKLGRVYITLKKEPNFEFCIEALWSSFICLPIKNQSISFAQNGYDHLKIYNWQTQALMMISNY